VTAAGLLAAFVGLAVTAGLVGWLYGRGAFSARRASRPAGPPPKLPGGYYAGLESLINEQPDRAVEIFTRLVEVDKDTIETHFALGSLYRRRGEVDRAIRIHENILARPSLSDEQRQQALWALAQDFLRAGVLDRSEKLLSELAATPTHRSAALLDLIKIYEMQNDWALAVATHRDLPAETAAERTSAVAHYHCELAANAIRQGRLADARRYLRLARGLSRRFARANLMRADLAAARGAHDLAARLLLRALDEDWTLLLEALPRLIEAVRLSGNEQHLEALVAQVRRPRGSRAADLAQALLLADVPLSGAPAELVQNFLDSEPELAELLRKLGRGATPPDDAQTVSAARALLRLAARGQRYQCASCGFASQARFWQCPGCKHWDSMEPIWMYRGGGAGRR
jgi:lipopolysaccharide biosynthesis regulator YciM